MFWLRDACLVYHPWLNELTVLGDKSLRPMADDLTHALVRTQQVISLAGNVFSGGIEEAVFDIKINPIQSEAARIGSPAAGGSFALVAKGCYKLITTLTYDRIAAKKRRTSLPRLGSAQVRRVVDQAGATERHMGR